MSELPGKNIYVVRIDPRYKDTITASLHGKGYRPSAHDVSGLAPAPWIFVDVDSKLYCTGKIGVEVAKPSYWHQITIGEFDEIHRLHAEGKDLAPYLAQLDERYRDLDWRDFPLTDEPDYERLIAQVAPWRKSLAEAMKAQTDSAGRAYITDNQVAEVLDGLDDRAVIYAIQNKKDPSELGTKYALRFRAFTDAEVESFRSEFRRLLKAEYEAHCQLCNQVPSASMLEALARPCTQGRARTYLSTGSTPRALLEFLYQAFPLNEWVFVPREDV